MTPFDPKSAIVQLAYWKQMTAECDDLGVYPWHLPKVAAKEAQIESIKRQTGFYFSSDYLDFLRAANGWKGLLIETDLFGTDDFLSDRFSKIMERQELLDFVQMLGVGINNIIVIGAAELDLDVFFLVSDKSKVLSGAVIWFGAQEVNRYENFADFFLGMIEYNADIARKLKAKVTN